jgi:CheY-like chemotaxis protein
MSERAHQLQTRSTVLVVEDEPDVCELLTDILEAEGLTPVCTQSAAEAFEVIRERKAFACMILDVNLREGMTGYDVARFARTIDPALPVVFVSGQSSPHSVSANGVPGALFVAKPFTAAELMAKVHMLVGDNDDSEG